MIASGNTEGLRKWQWGLGNSEFPSQPSYGTAFAYVHKSLAFLT